MRIPMMTLRTRLLAALVLLPLGASYAPVPAQAVGAASTVDPRIRLDWQVGTGRGGRPLIHGYVYNDYGRPASDVRLLVETLDASGAVIARHAGFIRGVVQWSDRAYFELPIRTPGASYRLSVTALDWKGSGGAL
jgi:hypothetical protein